MLSSRRSSSPHLPVGQPLYLLKRLKTCIYRGRPAHWHAFPAEWSKTADAFLGSSSAPCGFSSLFIVSSIPRRDDMDDHFKNRSVLDQRSALFSLMNAVISLHMLASCDEEAVFRFVCAKAYASACMDTVLMVAAAAAANIAVVFIP
jgi:hypothetical protein